MAFYNPQDFAYCSGVKSLIVEVAFTLFPYLTTFLSKMKKRKRVKKLLKTGAEIIGGAAGGAIGFIGGPAGAIGGGVAGVLVSKGLVEFCDRFLSRREQVRDGAAAGLVAVGIEQRMQSGEQLRLDSFFEGHDITRSKAGELFEGILLKCKNEYQEKKIRYTTKIFENVAFDSNIKPEHANQVLNVVDQLSYRQLVILAFVGQNDANKFSVRDFDYREDTLDLGEDIQFLLQDFVQLERQGLIYRNDDSAVLELADIVPGFMTLTTIGNEYFRPLNLDQMPEDEFGFIELIHGPGEPSTP